MKLYVLPVESACNAHCPFCITKFRHFENSALDFDDFQKRLREKHYDKIEVTGGGEPSLHPKITEIIDECGKFAPVQIYTNGLLNLEKIPDNFISICLSRAHFDDELNEKIMGVKYDIEKYKGFPLKLSLMLHRSGISSEEEVIKYLDWAKSCAKKVVIRQLFEYDEPAPRHSALDAESQASPSIGMKEIPGFATRNDNEERLPRSTRNDQKEGYAAYYKREFVTTISLFENSTFDITRLETGNRVFDYDGLEVEIEECSCACENDNPVLHATGVLAEGWE